MPDVSALLHDAAGSPAADPDLGAVVARADVLRRRRAALRSTGAAGTAVALVVGLLLVLPLDRDDALVQQPASPPPTTAPPSAPPSALPEAVLPPAGQGAPRQGAAGPDTAQVPADPGPGLQAPPAGPARPSAGAAAPAGAPGPAPSPAVAGAPAASAAPAPPQRASCSVTTDGAQPGDAPQSCSFTATQPGGYRVQDDNGLFSNEAAPDAWSVVVVRGGERTEYLPGRGFCVDDVIEPGDQVTVTLKVTRDASGVGRRKLSAGGGAGC
jgi:hypothetical protein